MGSSSLQLLLIFACTYVVYYITLHIHLSQRNNLQRQQIGEKHVCAKFPREALLSGYVEELNCETRDYKESVHRETPMVCKKFKVSSVFMLNSS